MSNTEEFINLLHKEMEQFIDEGYEKLDQQEYEMQEIGLIMHGQSDYYWQYPDEYEKDKKICELENEVRRLEHRLANCIEPKFKIGDKVWHCFRDLRNVTETVIECIEIEVYEGIIDIQYYDIEGFGFGEEHLFATEEEAKAKLREIQK